MPQNRHGLNEARRSSFSVLGGGQCEATSTGEGRYKVMKRITIAVVAVLVEALSVAATPTVTDVVAKQRYPWNGLVDISCKVTGIVGTTNGLKFAVAAVSQDSGDVRKCSNFRVIQNGGKASDRKVHTNGNYRLLWDAGADLGTGIYSNMVVRVTTRSVTPDKVQLWDGGPYWATTNIGADEPWEYGYCFWWGDTVGYKREDDAWVASDGSSLNFSFSEENTPTYGKNIDTLKNEGWITADCVLAPEHDAAYVQWGGEWRMPTDQELRDLDTKCDKTWTFVNGVGGWVISGKGDYASASIFLPSTDGWLGFYWSSVPHFNGGIVAWDLRVQPGQEYPEQPNFRFHSRTRGQAIRPVQGFTN